MKNRLWMVTALCAMLGAAGMTACSEDTTSSGLTNFLKVDHPSHNFDDTGDDPFTVIVTYSDKNGNPVANQTINASSKKVACAGTDTTSQVTDGTGRAKFEISPATLDDCRTTIVFSAAGANEANVKIQVGDGGSDVFTDSSLEIVIPSSKKVTMTKNSPDFEFKAQYIDNISSDIPINFKVADTSCVTLTEGLKRMTDTNGFVTNSIKALKDECKTTVTLYANNNESVSDVLEVNVTNATEYNVNLLVNISDEHLFNKRLNDIQVLGYFLSTEDASMVFSGSNQPKTFNQTQLFMSVTNDNLAKMYPKLYEFKDVEIELANGIQSIVVIAKNRVESPRGGFDTPVVAYAAVPVSMSNANSTIVADLKVLPYDITGKYHVISNFDFSSAFPSTPASGLGGNKYPAVEDMITGDWINFVTDLFNDAPTTLIEFAWINTIARIKDIDQLDDWIKNIFANTLVKGVATDLLRPIILCYADPAKLPESTKEEREYKQDCINKNGGNWAQKFTTIAPDVSDLITNMQFSGTIDIPEIDSDRPTSYKNGKETFDTLLFNWSLGTVPGSRVTCVNERDYYYVKTGANSCRVPMDLSGMIKIKKTDPDTGTETEVIESAISASKTWNGTIVENVALGDGQINIPSHGLKLYWVSILYNAIFGTIMPNAFGYGNYNSIQQKHYLIGLMEYFLFRPFVEDYVAKSEENPEKYPSLYITDTTKTCQRFVEALIKSKVSNTTSWNTVISAGADIICNNVIGGLDKKVVDQLNSFVIVTDNGKGLKSDYFGYY